ncbi:lipopolysaccharide assembly protein LapA domain-containing protein [Candidatus Venteria ishoeyi]|uniref:Cell division protein FtsL n=1 Tax=Candidatus Venteria ishoeyi TaxID=1899563 RepID=A0A1H6FHK6_9GAMM|nr:lipopolysaccharide assembly protein LapA domain-containing protein [Candidatus Venteria ishoeyi]MDM8544903.1 lipopolysaccharide assembly protein LapA domain-containing protein [Candidatus Venteria ishoeyi]SEH08535.1 Cell division protein FtsL [Candidatus Venteria ishoeyi]
MPRILTWLFFLLIFLSGVIFTVYNPHPVTLNYIIDTMQVRLAVLLLVSLLIGCLLGILFSAAWVLKLRYQNRRLRKNYQQASREIERLSTQQPDIAKH